jgi:hypothetical protein
VLVLREVVFLLMLESAALGFDKEHEHRLATEHEHENTWKSLD